jgi:hypothetical protein
VNIFVLDENPWAAARMHCDKHVPKMIVESAQMLSTAHRILDGKEYLATSKSGKRMTKHYLLERNDDIVYKAVHAAHPCTVWTMQSASNYIWHYGLFHALAEEFEYRFKKIHRSWDILKHILCATPVNIPNVGPTPYARAMKAYPELMEIEDPVKAYQEFYKADKVEFAKWEKGRSAPDWWNNK